MTTVVGHHQNEAEMKGDNPVVTGTLDKSRKHDFDLELVLDHFKKCLPDQETVVLHEYLNAFHELCRFFKLMGPLFSFVARDIESKVRAIEHHLQKKTGNNYRSMQSMVSYEIAKGKTHRRSPHPSGCRTLLRLHHALEFILAFMERIAESEDNAKTSRIAWQVYSETLSKHHPWVTRKLAFLAVYALPSKQELIEIMCKHDYNAVHQLLPHVFSAGQRVYDATQSVLESNDLLDIQ